MQPASQPATPEIPATAPVSAPDASTTPVTAETASEAKPRPEAPKPESDASTAILPPEAPKLPTPKPTTIESLQPIVHTTPAANQPHDNKALIIEQLLARFIGDRMPPESMKGLMVEVTLANSNAVTADPGKTGQHDIAITFKGGKLEDPKHAQEIAEQLRAAMREHPTFAGMSFGGIDQTIEHEMRCQILSLDADQLKALLTPQPKKHVTFITPNPDVALTVSSVSAPSAAAPAHACAGAGCSQCAATPAKIEDQPVAVKSEAPKPEIAALPEQAVAAPAANDASVAAPAANDASVAAAQPVAETKPENLQTAPVTTIENPAAAEGRVAANAPVIAKTA